MEIDQQQNIEEITSFQEEEDDFEFVTIKQNSLLFKEIYNQYIKIDDTQIQKKQELEELAKLFIEMYESFEKNNIRFIKEPKFKQITQDFNKIKNLFKFQFKKKRSSYDQYSLQQQNKNNTTEPQNLPENDNQYEQELENIQQNANTFKQLYSQYIKTQNKQDKILIEEQAKLFFEVYDSFTENNSKYLNDSKFRKILDDFNKIKALFQIKLDRKNLQQNTQDDIPNNNDLINQQRQVQEIEFKPIIYEKYNKKELLEIKTDQLLIQELNEQVAQMVYESEQNINQIQKQTEKVKIQSEQTVDELKKASDEVYQGRKSSITTIFTTIGSLLGYGLFAPSRSIGASVGGGVGLVVGQGASQGINKIQEKTNNI